MFPKKSTECLKNISEFLHTAGCPKLKHFSVTNINRSRIDVTDKKIIRLELHGPSTLIRNKKPSLQSLLFYIKNSS